MRRRSPISDSSGTSNTLSAPPPPRSTIAMRGWSPSACISKTTSASKTLPYQAVKRSRSVVRVATWLKPDVMGMAISF